jgi:hypothetical protein
MTKRILQYRVSPQQTAAASSEERPHHYTPRPAKGLTKRELRWMQRDWRTAARQLIKALPIPEHATFPDMVALFDAVLDEAKTGRKIVEVVGRAKPAKKAVA